MPEKSIFVSMKPYRLLLILLLAGSTAVRAEEVPFLPMKWERLPDLNIPRAGHQLLLAGGEMVVVGGHTEGFTRTPTAEYFSDGAWHLLKTVYPHDNGFSVRLPNGDFLIGGGSAEDFGVGQTYGAERYEPGTRTFTAFPILDIKRTLATAAVLPSGRIVVSGNWHADDAIGYSDGSGPFEILQKASQDRMTPFIFPFGKDDAVVFGGYSHTGTAQIPVVDRLHGEPDTPELFEQWVLPICFHPIRMEDCRAIDPESGREVYLFPAFDPDGRCAILCFSEGDFSRIPTDHEIPLEGPWGPIGWDSRLFVDQARCVALVQGFDKDGRTYLLTAECLPALRGEAASVCVYYTEPLPELLFAPALILPDGRFVTAGGHSPYDAMGNYNPSASVYAFSPFPVAPDAAREYPKWPFVLLALLLLTAAAMLLARLHHRPAEPKPAAPVTDPVEQNRESELFARIETLMEKEEWFRRKGLGVTDIATQLGTNTKYISNCINSRTQSNFTEYLNGYRIRYAQRLLREQPGIRLSEVSEAAGFTSESAFYRNFKVLTGQTPAEWLAEKQK